MKLTIHTDENIEDLKIEITCKQLPPEVERIIAAIHSTEPDLENVFVELTGKGLQ